MMIDDKRPDADDTKEVKVKIPESYHVKLHSLKVLTGKQISTTVTEALTGYFEDISGASEIPSDIEN